MKQILNKADGAYEVLELVDRDKPEPAEDEILIKVKAAGLNFADIQARKGQYPDAPPKPCVMGYEVAGVAEECGEQVEGRWQDAFVVAMTRFRGQSEYVTVPESQVFEKPEKVSFAEAAALPVNYLTAYVLTEVMGGLSEDESILIHNAGGGVGLAAVDVARHIGATIWGTASAHKHEFLRERGVTEVLDYRKINWVKRVKRQTGGKGVELVIDPMGGKHWKKSYDVLRSTGRLGMFGIASASRSTAGGIRGKWHLLKTVLQMPFYHPIPLMNRNRGVFGVNVGHLWDEQEKARLWMKNLFKGVEEGWIRPHVDTTFSFSRVADAHRYIEERRNIGKVILTPDND